MIRPKKSASFSAKIRATGDWVHHGFRRTFERAESSNLFSYLHFTFVLNLGGVLVLRHRTPNHSGRVWPLWSGSTSGRVVKGV